MAIELVAVMVCGVGGVVMGVAHHASGGMKSL